MDIKSLRKILLKKGFLLSKKSVVTKQTSLQNLYKISLLSLIIILFFYFLPSSVKFTQKILKPNLEINERVRCFAIRLSPATNMRVVPSS